MKSRKGAGGGSNKDSDGKTRKVRSRMDGDQNEAVE